MPRVHFPDNRLSSSHDLTSQLLYVSHNNTSKFVHDIFRTDEVNWAETLQSRLAYDYKSTKWTSSGDFVSNSDFLKASSCSANINHTFSHTVILQLYCVKPETQDDSGQ